MKKLYIFYPSFITGGAEYLFKKVAEMLYEEFEIIIIDYDNGWISRNVRIPEERYKVVIYKEEKIKTDDGGILLTASSYMRTLGLHFKCSNCLVLFWTIQPYNIIPTFPLLRKMQLRGGKTYTVSKNLFLRSEYNRYKNMISSAVTKKSLFCMDEETDSVLYDFFGMHHYGYLPVVLSDEKFTNELSNEVASGLIKAVWLGRLDNEFKYYALEKLMHDLDDYSRQENKEVHLSVIGDGPGKVGLMKVAYKLNNINTCFVGELRDSDLEKELKQNSLAFAMGTSAIETAAKGMPTILLDFSYERIGEEYRYRWLYESKNFTLGRNASRFKDKTCGNRLTVKDICILLEKEQSAISMKCFDYSIKNHSSRLLESLLVTALHNCELRIYDLYKLGVSSQPFWYRFKRVKYFFGRIK